jgi:hypothetical protein
LTGYFDDRQRRYQTVCGWMGVFWGLHTEAETPQLGTDVHTIGKPRQSAMGILVRPNDARDGLLVQRFTFRLMFNAIGIFVVRTSWVMDSVTIPWDGTPAMSLRARVVDGDLISAEVNGNPVEFDPVPARANVADHASGPVGVFCFNGQLAVTQASLHPLLGDH